MYLIQATIQSLRKKIKRPVVDETKLSFIDTMESTLKDSYSNANDCQGFDGSRYSVDSNKILRPLKDRVEKFRTYSLDLGPESMVNVYTCLIEDIRDAHHRAIRTSSVRSSILAQENYSVKTNRAEVRRLITEAKDYGTIGMSWWQSTCRSSAELVGQDPNIYTGGVSKLHACGNIACLAGHIRISSLFNAMYKFSENKAQPLLCDERGEFLDPVESVALLMGIPEWLASVMIYDCSGGSEDDNVHRLYKETWDEVRADHILEVLDLIDKCPKGQYDLILDRMGVK